MSASFGSMIDHGRKQVASWNLSSIPGCVSHHMADRGVTIGGGVVTNLGPRVGTWNFAPPLAGDSPIWDVGGMAPYPGIVFDGTDDNLQVTAATPLSDFRFLHDGTGCTLVVVFNRTAAAINDRIITTRGGAAVSGVTIGSGLVDATRLRLVINNGSGVVALDATAAAGSYPVGRNVVAYTLSAAAYNLRINGASVLSGGALVLGAGDPAFRMFLMGQTGGSLDITGSFAELSTYSRVLSATEITATEQYAKYRYGALVP